MSASHRKKSLAWVRRGVRGRTGLAAAKPASPGRGGRESRAGGSGTGGSVAPRRPRPLQAGSIGPRRGASHQTHRADWLFRGAPPPQLYPSRFQHRRHLC